MNKKTVLFTIDMYHIGGITAFIQQYANVLINNNYGVVILGMRGDLENPNTYFPKCNVVIIPKAISFSWIHRVLNIPVYLYYLNKIYSENNIICTHTSTIWSTLYTHLYPKSWMHPVVSTFYGAYYLEKESEALINATLSIKSHLRKYMQGMQYMFMKKIVVFNNYSKRLFRHSFSWIPRSKLTIIPGLISKKNISPYHPRFITRTCNQPSTLRVICMCRAEPRKGVKELLEAAAILKKQNVNFHLNIISPVSYFEYYGLYHLYENLQLSDRVQLSHAMDNTRLKDEINASDLFVMPSQQYETFGMTLLECLALGLPSVGTPLESVKEMLSRVDSLLIIKSTSPDDIAAKIKWYSLLSHKDKAALSEKSIQTVTDYYQLESYEEHIVRLYEPC